jgi:hypothetical protein
MKKQSIKFLKGDLLKAFDKGKFNCIAHQCNTLLTSEHCGGIAQAIFGKYEEASVSNTNRVTEQLSRYLLLGDISVGVIPGNSKETDRIVFNLYAQNNPGRPTHNIDSIECRLSYLRECLNKVKNNMIINYRTTLGIPLIASGLAKQNRFYDMPDLEYFRKFILPIIEDVFKESNIQITVMHL